MPTIDELQKKTKQLEAALEDEKARRMRLERILYSMDTGLSLINPDRSIEWANDKIREMFPVGEPVGRICHEFYESSTEPCNPCPTLQCFESGETRVVERYNPAMGKWYNIISQPVKDASGKIVNVLEGVTDITGQKNAEQALLRERDLLNRIMRTNPVGIAIVDRDGRISFANSRAEEILGLERSEIAKRTYNDPQWQISDLQGGPFPEENLPFAQVRRTGLPVFNIEHGIRWPDGKMVLLSINASPLFDENGDFEGMLATVQEISERVRAEEKIRKSERRYRLLFQYLTAGFALHEIVLDEKGNPCDYRFLDVNSAFENLTGVKKEDIVGRTVRQALPSTEPYWIETYGQVALTGKSIQFENFSREFGKYYDVVAYSPAPGRFATIFMDITGRKKIEASLKESEEKYRILVENANEAIFITQDEVIKFCNPMTEEMIGYSADQLARMPFVNMISSEHAELVLGRYRKRLEGESPPGRYSFSIRDKAGKDIWVELNAIPVMWEDRPAVLNFLTDITEQKKLEDQLRQAHKMEAVGTLSGGIAHEFNNILAIVLGNAELAMDDIPQGNPVREFLEDIHQASLRGRDIVRQLLSFSRKSDQEKQPLHLSSVLEESIGLLRASIPANIVIEKNIDGDCSAVMGDRTQIHQVIINLCGNAAQAMEESGGTLTIGIKNTSTKIRESFFDEELPQGDYLQLTVSDTGCGIPAEILDRIFDPFYSTKAVGKGTGMGLAVVHGIMKGHGGGIRIKSRPGKGTMVECYFPAIGDAPHEDEKVEETIAGGNESILFVDDDKSLTKLGKLLLERIGYHVKTGTNPLKALELFRENPGGFDLVITDMTMPQMTGDQFVVELKKIRPDVKTIICTGYSRKMDDEKAELLGVGGFIMKPFNLEALAKTVRQVLEGH